MSGTCDVESRRQKPPTPADAGAADHKAATTLR
jgi:hypothetical protein